MGESIDENCVVDFGVPLILYIRLNQAPAVKLHLTLVVESEEVDPDRLHQRDHCYQRQMIQVCPVTNCSVKTSGADRSKLCMVKTVGTAYLPSP